MGEARLAAAEFIVALTRTSARRELAVAALARKSTDAISTRYEDEIALLWRNASEETLQFVRLVMKNNPTKTVDQILQRSDVQQALAKPYAGLGKSSADLVVKGWEESERDAEAKVRSELMLLQVPWKGYRKNRTLRRQINADLARNASQMQSRLVEAMRRQHHIYDAASTDPVPAPREDGRDELQLVADDSVLRARYSIQTAIWSAARAVRDGAYRLAGVNKKWKSRRGPNMCSHCRRLHNCVVGPFDEFPHHFEGLRKLAVYKGRLFGPPRHPNCQCITVATREARTV